MLADEMWFTFLATAPRWTFFGGEPARIMPAAHLAYLVRTSLQRQNPACHHGGEQVAAHEAVVLRAAEVGAYLHHLGNRLGVLGCQFFFTIGGSMAKGGMLMAS